MEILALFFTILLNQYHVVKIYLLFCKILKKYLLMRPNEMSESHHSR